MKRVRQIWTIVAREGGQFLGCIGECDETQCVIDALADHDCVVLVGVDAPRALHMVPPEYSPKIEALLREGHTAVTGLESPGRG